MAARRPPLGGRHGPFRLRRLARCSSDVSDSTCPPPALRRSERVCALGAGGATIWFTGLPASGKSTVAAAVERRLVAAGRSAYRLDGDVLRMGISRDLGFDQAARAENVRRAAEVARLMADAGTVALVALVSPYRADRAEARALHERHGLPFVEVWVSAPLALCERRDPKGLYARARRGELAAMTGVDDPYEAPSAPELELAGDVEAQDGASRVIELLEALVPAATAHPR